MFNRNRSLRYMAAIVSISLVSGCGLLGDESSDEAGPIVMGTTSAPSTLDPAAAWDGSWELFRNIYQTLLSYPPGATTPQPDAAENCKFDDSASRVYRCTLRDDLKFSNGDAIDAEAVKYSVDRIKKINAETGPAGLLGSLKSVEVSGDREVTFKLNKSDATFPFVLATPGLASSTPTSTPPTPSARLRHRRLRTVPAGLVRGGQAGRPRPQRQLQGFADRKNDAVTIRYFQDSGEMVKALRAGDIDITYQGLAADDIVALDTKGGENAGLQIVEGVTANINYLVFNPKDPWSDKLAVRRAVAQVVDRAAIAHKVYKDTVDPLYSMVPTGLTGHTTAFFDDFGDPDPKKARAILTEAGITQTVPLTLWYTTDRYGSDTALEFKELKRQLEASGLFKVTLKSRPWNTYVVGYQKGEYPVFGRGWSPDFPDADNFIAPFVGEQNALGTPYPAKEITQVLLPRSREESDRANVVKDFEAAQQILVDDARLLPLWQGKQYLAVNEDLSGAERSLDPSTIMMVWELSRKTSW